MAEVLAQFDQPVRHRGGASYVARVCGRVAEDGLWEGWLEFIPEDGGKALRTRRETEQPNRRDLEYWATGLTVAYLEGALERALRPVLPDLRPREVAARPVYDAPAPSAPVRGEATSRHIRPRPVLDPFAVYAQGEGVLRQELMALSEAHLIDIARAYDLANEAQVHLPGYTRAELAQVIVAGVRQRSG